MQREAIKNIFIIKCNFGVNIRKHSSHSANTHIYFVCISLHANFIYTTNRLRFTKWSEWKKRYFRLETLYQPSRLSVERCKTVDGASTFLHCNIAKKSTLNGVRVCKEI